MALWRERREEIERVWPGIWRVPSCSGGEPYTVNTKYGTCSCPDIPPEGERCKHYVAASIESAKRRAARARARARAS